MGVVNHYHVYIKIGKAICGLLQASIFTNKLLKKCLEQQGYYDVRHNLDLWWHYIHPIHSSLLSTTLELIIPTKPMQSIRFIASKNITAY